MRPGAKPTFPVPCQDASSQRSWILQSARVPPSSDLFTVTVIPTCMYGLFASYHDDAPPVPLASLTSSGRQVSYATMFVAMLLVNCWQNSVLGAYDIWD